MQQCCATPCADDAELWSKSLFTNSGSSGLFWKVSVNMNQTRTEGQQYVVFFFFFSQNKWTSTRCENTLRHMHNGLEAWSLFLSSTLFVENQLWSNKCSFLTSCGQWSSFFFLKGHLGLHGQHGSPTASAFQVLTSQHPFCSRRHSQLTNRTPITF